MINDELDFDETRTLLLYTPEGRMMAHIFLRAITDLVKKKCGKKDLRIAVEFLSGDDDLLKICCWLLKLPIVKVNQIPHNKELLKQIYQETKSILFTKNVVNSDVGFTFTNPEEDDF